AWPVPLWNGGKGRDRRDACRLRRDRRDACPTFDDGGCAGVFEAGAAGLERMEIGGESAVLGRFANRGGAGTGRTWASAHGRDVAARGGPAADGRGGRPRLWRAHLAGPTELRTHRFF